jgi:arylsulfatase A-like enzyme
MALTTPAFPDYDPLTAPRYEEYLRRAYAGADRLLGFILGLCPDDVIVAVSADHGFGAAWLSVNANLVLEQAGLLVFDADGRPAPGSSAAAYWTGGTCNVYINLAGREPGGVVAAEQFEPVRQRIIAAFEAVNAMFDAGAAGLAPGGRVIERIFRYEETNAVPTSCGPATMQFAGRTGDLVVFAAPPAQFDAPDPRRIVSPSPLHGQHGYLPDTADATLNVNMRPPLVLAGPGVRRGATIRGGRAVDIAPTLAALLGIEPPRDADGRVLAEVFEPAD